MKLIGIHDGHNASVCLMENGQIICLIQEERITREKNYDGFPHQSLKKIMHDYQLSHPDIDRVILNGNHQPKPMSRMERMEAYINLGSFANRIKSSLKKINLIDSFYLKANNQRRIKNLTQLGFSKEQVSFIDHHSAHAATAYYANNNYNEDVLILTNDGAGDRLCATISIGSKGKITRKFQVHENYSIGLFYAMFTFLTGMVPLEHEYKIMGMAPYADKKGARKVADKFHEMFCVNDNGLTWEFIKGGSIFTSLPFFKEFMFLKRFDHLMAGLQTFVEEFLANWIKAAITETGIKKVVLAGGTFLNVKANKAIMELDELDELFVFPSCGDESNAIGVCYEYYAIHGNYHDIKKLNNIYFGTQYTNDSVYSSFMQYSFKDKHKYKYKIEKFSHIAKETATLLAGGNVVARFYGREEFGARSLGNRAILADPSHPEIIKVINELIKNRDFWMPFACSILDSDINHYVKTNDKTKPYYMNLSYDTKDAAADIPGGIHPYDKTVRPQLVSKEHNEEYWHVINEFKKITRIGAIINTSLNLHGLPLVHSPEDAFEVLEKSQLRYLVVENYIISKLDVE